MVNKKNKELFCIKHQELLKKIQGKGKHYYHYMDIVILAREELDYSDTTTDQDIFTSVYKTYNRMIMNGFW